MNFTFKCLKILQKRIKLFHLYFFISQAVYSEPPLNAKDLRALVKCVDGVFDELVDKHKELEKYHTEYKVIAMKTTLRLDKCEKIENIDHRKL